MPNQHAKNIILCCDGTWNNINNADGKVISPTNVVQLYNSLAKIDQNGIPQHRYYHPGVGTEGSKLDRIIEGITGDGLDKNIKSAYRELCEYYQDGDKIFLFGFSRGAYTVRSLSGFIALVGLLEIDNLDEQEIWDRIDHVYSQGYRLKNETRSNWNTKNWHFKNPEHQLIPIHFMGVWETVGALGIPDYLITLNLLDRLNDYTFHDTVISKNIKTARHAVALDEQRASFQPTLWADENEPNQDVQQVWFAGVHSDIGGGYQANGLAQVALRWMINEAMQYELAFNTDYTRQITPNEYDILHDSYSGIFKLFPCIPRSIPRLDSEAIHITAQNRQQFPPIRQSPYHQVTTLPTAINIYAMQPWNQTGIWLEKGISYSFKADGIWMDGSIKATPQGSQDGVFKIAELAHVFGTLLGKIEDQYKKLTGNKNTDYYFTRRQESMPWFCLVGIIANGKTIENADQTQKMYFEPHEAFQIGSGTAYTPKQSGYFYAYANDAWNCYSNNRGRVNLAIQVADKASQEN